MRRMPAYSVVMEAHALHSLADDLLAEASERRSGRATRVLHGGPSTRMSSLLMALPAGGGLSDHENPGEALLYVVRGLVTLTAGDESLPMSEGDFSVIPDVRHGLDAVTDAVIQLTVLPRGS